MCASRENRISVRLESIFRRLLGISHRIQNQNQNPKDNRIRCKIERIQCLHDTPLNFLSQKAAIIFARREQSSEFKDIKICNGKYGEWRTRRIKAKSIDFECTQKQCFTYVKALCLKLQMR